MSKILVVLASMALAAVVGCGDPAPHSALRLSRVQGLHYLVSRAGRQILAAKDMARLRRAVSEAPGGRLHDDLRSLERDIDSHQNFIQTNSAPKDVVVGTDAAQVAADCESANPG